MMRYYLHIPFCHSKCAYCDFYSMACDRVPERQSKFVEAVEGEIEGRIGGIKPFDTLYFGGGTPSSLPVHLLSELCQLFLDGQDLSKIREFTIEVNPEDVTEEFISFLTELPIQPRISMGIQSLVDEELISIGRKHSARKSVESYTLLRSGGIRNISLDLIYGLPGQSLESWQYSLDRLLALKPDHLSAYILSYEPGTRLTVRRDMGKIEEADDQLIRQMYTYLCKVIREAHYEHYEVSNFSRPGRRAIHNSAYWKGDEYIGLGPGAHSYVNGRRGSNRSSLKDYLESGGCGIYEEEPVLPHDEFNDLIITSLRTADGLDPARLSRYEEAERGAGRLLSEGRLIYSPSGSLIIPEDKWIESDSIMRELIVV